ncbi:MAG: hypothetical protein HY321_12195 [Armatimonadetes bacterium]|nr:hypothetical protein [Armatimonadota bacterium]
MSRITLLAVTRMQSGVCVAGMDEEGHWVRPVKERATLTLGDITYPGGQVAQAFDVTEFPVLRPRPQPPHLEDCVSDFIRARPRLSRHLTPAERAAFLDAHAEPGADAVLSAHRRSLCLVRARRLDAFFQLDTYSGKYEARLAVDGGRPLPVTDLRWRALGRNLPGERDGERRFPPEEVARVLGTDEVYVAYGLSRSFQGQIWALVVGVHPVPDFAVTVDYRRM